MGQYLGVGGMSVVGQLCPILKGVGYSAIVMVFLENVYYIIIVAWTLFYIFNTIFSLGNGLPWESCEKGSKLDSDLEIAIKYRVVICIYQLSIIPDGTWAPDNCYDPEADVPFNQSTAYLVHGIKSESETTTPVESYWK